MEVEMTIYQPDCITFEQMLLLINYILQEELTEN
jgi:hypothetical protein